MGISDVRSSQGKADGTGTADIQGSDLLEAAIVRTKHTIFRQSLTPRKLRSRIFASLEPDTVEPKKYITSIEINQVKALFDDFGHEIESHEAYRLDISADGRSIINVTDTAGAIWAMQTFSQLVFADRDRTSVYIPTAPIHIVDFPAYSHRGINLDIARNPIYPEDAIRVLDAMAMNKMNRLHIHATDSQSWPIEVPAIPELALEGAYDLSQIWSVEDLKTVQDFGRSRGIEVFLEIDLPGHTGSISHSHPDLITAFNKHNWSDFGAEPPTGQLKLNSEKVEIFLDTLLGDLLPRINTYSGLFHLGGDEVNGNAYALDPTVNSSSPEVIQPYLQKFMDHVISLADAQGLTPIMWEEMVLQWNLTLPASTIIQSWRSSGSFPAILARGYRALFGAATHWYLDCGFGTFLDPTSPTAQSSVQPPYKDWCSPYHNWRQVYTYDPVAEIPKDQRHLIAGGEVHIWGELTDSVNLDHMLWPRAAAAAEVMWTGTGRQLSPQTTGRLAEMRDRLVKRGIRADMVQMEWCLRNEGECVL